MFDTINKAKSVLYEIDPPPPDGRKIGIGIGYAETENEINERKTIDNNLIDFIKI
jgi:hypothetical protein